MATYKQLHESKDVAKIHIAKIKERGGKVKQSVVNGKILLEYSFSDGEESNITTAIKKTIGKRGGFEFSHSFKNDRGNEVTQYKIEGGGYARVEKYADGFVITNIIIEKENQGKGYAKNLYEKLNKESVKETGKTLQSLKPDENGKIELSSDGQRFWKSIEKRGLAKSIANNRWRFTE